MKILVLHGYLTNSKIIQYQTIYLRSILNYNFIIPNAPNVSIKKPYEINTKFFQSPYYQWYNNNNDNELKKSINYIKTLGKFDGVLGYSQGAGMATNILDLVDAKFFISIVGVNPNIDTDKKINIPSYHIIGNNDRLKDKSIKLANMFNNPQISFFDGGHTFPLRNHENEYIKCNEFIKNVITKKK